MVLAIVYLKKLKIILQSKYFYVILLTITIIYCFIVLKFNYYHTNYNIYSTKFVGIITNIVKKEKLNIITVKNKEYILVYDYGKANYSIGDKIDIEGSFKRPDINSNFYLFNYRNYLMSKSTYWIVEAENIKILGHGNIFYKFKKNIIKRIDNIGNPYLNAFIIGDTSSISKDVKESYQINGISHLFAISGMHIGLIIFIINFVFKKIFKFNNSSIIIIIIILLLFYLFLTGCSKSIVRASIFYICMIINKKFNLNVSSIGILLMMICITLVINPFNIYNTAFLFTYTVTIALVVNYRFINEAKIYFHKLFRVSLISFLVTMPIVINNYFQINLLSIILNLIFVPFVSLFIFPISVVVFLIPTLNPILQFLIYILENLSLFFSKIDYLKITLCHINIFFFSFYYIVIIIILISINKKKYERLLLLVILIFIHTNYRYIDSNMYSIIIDVNQGDSFLLILPNNKGNILIDTGGSYKGGIANNIIIPTIKSRGIKNIDYLIITHGDYDHMGEAINLVNNFKVEKVIFNCGPYNDLEKELIKVLDKKHIKYYSCIKELNIDKNKLYFLQTKKYDNENDNSNVIYTELDGFKFMFMGDASTTTEKEILDKYNLLEIDVLKVGHHGSKTSSGKEFINEINPKYSIISVGKNNRYGHPNKEVLNNLEKSKIYRTDMDGSIMFKIKNYDLKIETCVP